MDRPAAAARAVAAAWAGGIALCTAVTAGAAPPAPTLAFVRSAVNLPATATSVRTDRDLDGDGRRDLLAVLQRRVLMFFQRPGGAFPAAPDVEIGGGRPIPEDYFAVSTVRVGAEPGRRLVLVGRQGLDSLSIAELKARRAPGEAIAPKPLLELPLGLAPEPELAFVDLAVDLAGDGRESLVIPDGDRLEFFSPDARGRFAAAGKVNLPSATFLKAAVAAEPPALGGLFGNAAGGRGGLIDAAPRFGARSATVRYSLDTMSEPYLICDIDGDRRPDVLTPATLFRQSANGLFEGTPSAALSRISRSAGVRDGRLRNSPNLADFNADGIPDSFRIETVPAKPSPRTDISVFLGKPAGKPADEAPDFTLRTRDFPYTDSLTLGDLDGDGCPDLAMVHVDFQPASASSQFKAYMKNGLAGDLRFTLWDKRRGRYPETFAFSHPVNVSYDIFGNRQLLRRQMAMDSDLDGDGAPDLVLKTGSEEISVFRNEVKASRRFAAAPMAVVSTAPTRFSSLRAEDLDGDGRGDLILTAYQEGIEDRVIHTFLITRPAQP